MSAKFKKLDALAMTIASALLLWGGAWAASSAAKGWRDVLDTPSLQSPLAPQALVNGMASQGQRTLAVGQRGHILYSDDAGQRWRQAEVPVSSDLVAVSFPDARQAWAVGHDGVVLHSEDAGQSWRVQYDGLQAAKVIQAFYDREAAAIAAGDAKEAQRLQGEAARIAEQGTQNPWLDVWFRDAKEGYVVGAFGLALHTTDGGAHWTPVMHQMDNPKALHLYALRGIGADLYAVGEQGLLLKRAAGDTRFRAIEVPYQGTLFGLTGNERALIAYGLRGTVLRSTDAGRSWKATPTNVPVGLTAGTQSADGRILLVSQAGHVLASRDDGASFSVLPMQGSLPAAAVAAPAAGQLIVGGPRGTRSLQLP